ncbi:uncharacterized protein LOC141642473 [Silene latifolia]|uniref:uncharacterized protein LOC141642473 n=1 Tax=Silene latifolia TaxID=37657 RepID=UPI003D76C54D
MDCEMPWLWAGDFNTVLSPLERLGGNTIDAEMQQFQDCVSICCMEDVPATGALFTWSNKQEPNERVYSRLDRMMGNQEWFMMFADYVAHFHPEGILVIVLVVKKLKALKPVLKNINKECFSDIENNTSIASALLDRIQKNPIDNPGNTELMQQEYDTAHELRELIVAR